MEKGEIRMKNEEDVSWIISLIKLALYLALWPVGIFLLVRKIRRDRKALMKAGKIMRGFGIFLVVVVLFSSISEIAEPTPGTSMGDLLYDNVVLGGLGVALLIGASRIQKTAALYRRFIDRVVNHHETNIGAIASSLSMSTLEARKCLERMIRMGYFNQACISEDGNELILGYSSEEDYEQAQLETLGHVKRAEKIVAVCRSCGAQNTIEKGSVGVCEYCGSRIK